MTQLNRTLVFKVKENEYPINYPTTGQFLDIEIEKAMTSKGSYRLLIETNTISSNRALDLIDTYCFLKVTCPSLMKDIKAESGFMGLDQADAIELQKAYSEQINPWLLEWNKVLSSPPQKEVEGTDSK